MGCSCILRCGCKKSMNHAKEGVPHESKSRCRYSHQYDNRVYTCKVSYKDKVQRMKKEKMTKKMRNITGMCLFSSFFFFIFNVRGAHSLGEKNWSLFHLAVCLESSSLLCAMCHFLAKFWKWLLLTWVMLTSYILDMVALICLCPELSTGQFLWRTYAGDRKIFGYNYGLYWCRNTSLMLLLTIGLVMLFFKWVLMSAPLLWTSVC